jgi:hypothetical protein
VVFIDTCITSQDLAQAGPDDYLNVSLESGDAPGNFRMGMEHHGGHPETLRIFATNTWYWITAMQDTSGGANYQVSWYSNNAGSLVLLTNLTDTAQVGAASVHLISMGPIFTGSSMPGFMYFDNLKVITNGTYPVLP